MAVNAQEIVLPDATLNTPRMVSRRTMLKAFALGMPGVGNLAYPFLYYLGENVLVKDSYKKFREKFIVPSEPLTVPEERELLSRLHERDDIDYILQPSREYGGIYEGTLRSNGNQLVCAVLTGDYDDQYSMPVYDIAIGGIHRIHRAANIQSPLSNRVKLQLGFLPKGEFPFAMDIYDPAGEGIRHRPILHFFTLNTDDPVLKTLLRTFPDIGVKEYDDMIPFLGQKEDMLVALEMSIRKMFDSFIFLNSGFNTKEIQGDPHRLWNTSPLDYASDPRTFDLDIKQMVIILMKMGILSELSHMGDTNLQDHDIPVDQAFDTPEEFTNEIDTSLQEVGRHGMVNYGTVSDIVYSYLPCFSEYDSRGEDWETALQVISFRQLLARGQLKEKDKIIDVFIETRLGGKDLIRDRTLWLR